MADFHSQTTESFQPSQNQHGRSDSIPLGTTSSNTPPPATDNGAVGVDNSLKENQSPDGDKLASPQHTTAPPPSGPSPEQIKQVNEVLTSEV